MKHWTQQSVDDFAYNLSLDFFTQLEDRIEGLNISRKELAERLGVSAGAVSQTLNSPSGNPK